MKGDWYKVDNVANVFLATMVKRDTRSLRVSITLKEDIKKGILKAADKAVEGIVDVAGVAKLHEDTAEQLGVDIQTIRDLLDELN